MEVEVLLARPGIYPITIRSETDDGETTGYEVNLVIDTPTSKECNDLFTQSIAGMLSTADTTIDSIVYSRTSVTTNDYDGELYFSEVLLSYGTTRNNTFLSYIGGFNDNHVKFIFDCSTGTITIPEQEVVGISMSGGNIETFNISGIGGVDTEKGIFGVSYKTVYDDNGTIVTTYLKAKGSLQ